MGLGVWRPGDLQSPAGYGTDIAEPIRPRALELSAAGVTLEIKATPVHELVDGTASVLLGSRQVKTTVVYPCHLGIIAVNPLGKGLHKSDLGAGYRVAIAVGPRKRAVSSVSPGLENTLV